MFYCQPHPYELVPIGTIWATDCCPMDTTSCSYRDYDRNYVLELDAVYFDGCIGLETISELTILYWLREANRSVLKSNPPDDAEELGVFATCTLDRPNPIGIGLGLVRKIEKNLIHVSGRLECPTGTPILDLRPETLYCGRTQLPAHLTAV